MRILLIDNNYSFVHKIEAHLKQNNYECISIDDAITGLALILEERFDILILNADLPEFSDDIIDFIAMHGKLNRQKIIMLNSVYLSKKRVNELLEDGMLVYFNKSLAHQELFHIIKTCYNSSIILKQKYVFF